MSTTEPDKRMIPYDKFIEWATMPMPDSRKFYRDLFMLSFYLCGIRPVDLLMVKKSQVQEGRLVYCPQKLNGRTKLSIKIEPEAWEIIRKYEGEEYLINVLESRSDYRAFCQHWNKALKAIGTDVITHHTGRRGKKYYTTKHEGIIPYITVYYARTNWATYAYNLLNISEGVISQALGHKNGLKVTNFYIKRDPTKVDEANRLLIDKVTADIANAKQK
jgi:integrase